MNETAEKLFNASTYGVAGAGIVVNFDDIKGAVLFILGVILISLQIRLHLIKIKKEKDNK